MRRKKLILTYLPMLILAGVFAFAADDVQVIPSSKSVLSIYSYGGSADGKPTGALTDVARTSAISVTAPLPQPSSTPLVKKGSATVNKGIASIPAKPSLTARKRSTSGRPKTSGVGHTVITVAWDRSPDPSVAGYQLYTGHRSYHYSAGRPLGDKTSARVVVDRAVVYVAVSAYTATGSESGRCAELVLRAPNR